MKHTTFSIFLALVCAFTVFAQKDFSKDSEFDMVDFNKKFEIAQWLVEYDNVAWKTSDVVMQQDKKDLERLGPEWFAFKDNNGVWHAVYGKLGEKGYETVFYFVMDQTGKITKSDSKLSQEVLDAHARALATGRTKLVASISEDSPRFNQYIRQNPDKTFSVWLLPAFQTNGVAVYGGEGIYSVDATGKKLLKDESYFQPKFRGFKSTPPREVWLDFKDIKKPSLGAIFFVWYYKPYFTQIFIDTEKFTSTTIKTDRGYIWTHIEKKPDAVPKTNK